MFKNDACSMMSQAQERRGVHNIVGSRTTLLQALEWHHRLEDKAYVVDGTTGSGRGRWWRIRASIVVGNGVAKALGRT
jgi:hypothetical protein